LVQFLKCLLKIKTPQAVGHIVMLWLWSIDNAPDGDLSQVDAEDIAKAAEWLKNAEEFVTAMQEFGLIDTGMQLHDWGEYAGRLMDQRDERRRKDRERQARYRAKKAEGANADKGISHTDVTRDKDVSHACVTALPNLTKQNQTKPIISASCSSALARAETAPALEPGETSAEEAELSKAMQSGQAVIAGEPDPQANLELGRVMTFYMNRINAAPSQSSIGEAESCQLTPIPSKASTPKNRPWLLASEASAAGYTSDKPAPDSKPCPFCGRMLEHKGIILPFVPKILFSSPEPERCTCPETIAYWEQYDREKAERKVEERRKVQAATQARINRLFKDSGMRGRFQNRTFDRWEITEQNRRVFATCKKYADSFDIMLPTKGRDGRLQPPEKERNGLFIVGGYGTGKTHLAAAIANQLMKGGMPVICMTMIDLLARIRETYDKGGSGTEAQVMRLYPDVSLLIIDDLGSEQPTEWGSTTIFSIINARYEAYMPTIVTSNCGAGELVQRMTPRDATDRNAQKTVDRLREMCVAIQMDWPSWRTK